MLFSVIVPVYNGIDYLARCLDSVLGQRMKCGSLVSEETPDADMEIVIVDDGSKDGTSELCDRYAAQDARIKVVHQENKGTSAARRVGILASTGDYICYVDADDTVRPNWLYTIATCVKKGNEPDLLTFGIAEHRENTVKETISDLPEGLYEGIRLRKEVFPYVLADRRKVYISAIISNVAWNKVYRRELLLAHYNRDERIKMHEDVAFVHECTLYARSLYVTHRVLYDYNRSNPSSVSAYFGTRLTKNNVYLSYYLKSRLTGLGVDKQLNDHIFCYIIRSMMWKACNLPTEEAKEAISKELAETRLLEHVRLRGLPPMPAMLYLALRLRLYGPAMTLLRIKNKGLPIRRNRKDTTGKDSGGHDSNGKHNSSGSHGSHADHSNNSRHNSHADHGNNSNHDSNDGHGRRNSNSDHGDHNSSDPGNHDSNGSPPIRPKLSFIVPVYRTEKYLQRCIESILMQTIPDLELILIDDGSPDDCPRICDIYAEADSRVRVIHQENAGVVIARNRGIDIAKGDYVLMVDSDDYVSPHLAAKICDIFGKNRRPDLIIFPFQTLYDGHTESPRLPKAGFYSRGRIEAEILPYYISEQSKKQQTPRLPPYLFCKAFRRDFLMNHRFREEDIAIGEDAAQSFECVFYSRSLFICNEILYYYDRTNEGSVTRRYRADLPQMTAALISRLEHTIGGKSTVVDRQLNNYFAYRILRIVNIEAEHKKPIFAAGKRLRGAFRETKLLDHVSLKGQPVGTAISLALLKAGLITPLLISLRIYNAAKQAIGFFS
ncbi:MAG: glycosyltransferase [Lachnospiraceae bacterium]|nr:glycosyltransferase [Lachnospiraceae bacterium]